MRLELYTGTHLWYCRILDWGLVEGGVALALVLALVFIASWRKKPLMVVGSLDEIKPSSRMIKQNSDRSRVFEEIRCGDIFDA